MTLEEFFELFRKNAEADIGEGLLDSADLEHLKAVFEDTLKESER